MKFIVNERAIIFLDIDKLNNFYTIAYNLRDDEIISIRPREYLLLKYIKDNKGAAEKDLINFGSKLFKDQKEIFKTIEVLFKKQILIPVYE